LFVGVFESKLTSHSTSTLDHLNRIASKPGVKSTLILSKTDGAIIRSTGLVLQSQKESGEVDQDGYRNEESKQQKTAEEMAKLAFSFITAAGGLVNEMDESDDVQLLRLRTKKNEIVIVPGMLEVQ
jgi:dynein light chain roadblock-type